jgi:hypothetical protein
MCTHDAKSLQDKNEPNGGIKAPAFVPGAGVATNN